MQTRMYQIWDRLITAKQFAELCAINRRVALDLCHPVEILSVDCLYSGTLYGVLLAEVRESE